LKARTELHVNMVASKFNAVCRFHNVTSKDNAKSGSNAKRPQ
jgi:hypothetical protein